MTLEQELRQALKRKDPASGFDDRVLSRIAAGETTPLRPGTRRWRLASLPIAASLILSFGAAYYVQQQQQRQADEALAHAEQTTRNVVLALRIASETISAAQAKVEEMTRYEPKNDY